MTRESKSRWRVIARERYVAGESAHIEYVIGQVVIHIIKALYLPQSKLLH